MTETQKINADAKSAFDKGDYPLAFQTLWKVGIDDFVSYAQKEDPQLKFKPNKLELKCNWFTHFDSAKFFWENFILTEIVFDAIFNSDSADQVLHNYFSRCKIQVQKFETKLASKFPETFVKAIRINQVFLKADRIENLNYIQLDCKFQLHQKLWKRVYEIEQSQWKEIETELRSASIYSLNNILSHCIIWLETNRFTDSSQQSIHHLSSVYNFFIELVLSKYPEKNQDILNGENFFKQFLEIFTSLYKDKKTIEENPISKLLIRISHWINFKEHVISPYSFDLNIEPIQQNELVFFNSTPVAYYKWLVDGVRYEVNQLNYILRGNEFVEYLEQKNLTKIPGNTEKDIQLNRNLASSKWATLLLLDDLACESFQIGNTRIEPEKLLSPLLTYSFNRLSRYENSLKIHFENSQSWSEAFTKLMFQSIATDIRREPFFLMTESEYKQLNKEALSQIPEHFTTEVVQLFSYIPNTKSNFNRFHLRYDVWQKPFSKIGDFLFCPMMFFASNIWFYSFSQAALLQKTFRSETEKMENHFGDLIKLKGWNVKVISDEEAGELIGDVDIFVEDNDTLLFIQLKRTYFRLDLKDAYYEAINTDSKAAKQLNDAEKYLEKKNPIYQSKHKPVKWIVSTSFENIGSKIKGCFKVNYFEFLNALNNPDTKKLSDLVNELESNKNLKAFLSTIFNAEIPIEVRQMISETVKPLVIFESKYYKQTIFSEDEKETEKYNSIFSEAIKLDAEGKQNDALVLFQKCVLLNPNDGDAFGAIANILADMRVYESALITFREALRILPNDPYITRNFCLALMESGNWYEGLFKAAELYEKYPMLGDLKILFEKHFEQCVKHGLLNTQQLLELNTKWDNMN